MQCGLTMFINMDTKQFYFNGVFLPVKMNALRRWDSRSMLLSSQTTPSPIRQVKSTPLLRGLRAFHAGCVGEEEVSR
jgi:hypothetical protein